MAIRMGSEGEMSVVVTARDEASAVVEKFAANAERAVSGAQGRIEAEGKGKNPTPWVQQHLKELEKGRAEFDKWNVSAAALGKGLAGAAFALTTFTITAASASLKHADSMGKLAKEAGLNTREFSALAYHFKLSDLNAQGLSRVLFTMERNLGQAARTGKGITDVVESMGLKVGDLVKLRPDEAFLRLSDALAKLEDPFARAEAMQKLFGMSSRQLAEGMQGGADAIRRSMEEAKSLNVIIDENTARDADQFFDNLTKLSSAVSGMGNALAGGISDDLVKLSNALVIFVKDNAGLKAFGIVLRAIAETLVFLAKVLATVITAVAAVGRDIGEILGGMSAAFDAIKGGRFKEGANILQDMITEMGRRGEETTRTLKELWGLIDQAPDKASKSGALTKSVMQGEAGQGGFVRTGGAQMWSDVLPGAELVGAQEQELAQTQQHHATVEQMELDHRLRQLGVRQLFEAQTLATVNAHRKLDLDSASTFFGAMSGLVQTKSRALFQIGKAAAIAETIIQTYRAAQGAFASMAMIPYVGPILGAAAAAAAIAVGLARVQAIRGTEFGSQAATPTFNAQPVTGLPTAFPGAALPAAPAGTPAGAAQGTPATRREVNVTLIGNAFSAQVVRDELIPLLNDAAGDGVAIRVTSI